MVAHGDPAYNPGHGCTCEVPAPRAGRDGGDQVSMRIVVNLMTFVGFAVVAVFLVAIGIFAYDEVGRRMTNEDFEPTPAESSEE